MSIIERAGDATQPTITSGRQGLLVHLVNNRGLWGKGFVLAISRRWPVAEQAYRSWSEGVLEPGEARVGHATCIQTPFELGGVQLVNVEQGLWVASVCALQGVRGKHNIVPLHYGALRTGLEYLTEKMRGRPVEAHMPRIGAGLAGGQWPVIRAMIGQTLGTTMDVTVYHLEGK